MKIDTLYNEKKGVAWSIVVRKLT